VDGSDPTKVLDRCKETAASTYSVEGIIVNPQGQNVALSARTSRKDRTRKGTTRKDAVAGLLRDDDRPFWSSEKGIFINDEAKS
jgi:hypothetical protein